MTRTNSAHSIKLAQHKGAELATSSLMDSFKFDKIGGSHATLLSRISDNPNIRHPTPCPVEEFEEFATTDEPKVSDGSGASLLARIDIGSQDFEPGTQDNQNFSMASQPTIVSDHYRECKFSAGVEMDRLPNTLRLPDMSTSDPVNSEARDWMSSPLATVKTTSDIEEDGMILIRSDGATQQTEEQPEVPLAPAQQYINSSRDVSDVLVHGKSLLGLPIKAVCAADNVSDSSARQMNTTSSSIAANSGLSLLEDLYLDAQRITALWDEELREKKRQHTSASSQNGHSTSTMNKPLDSLHLSDQLLASNSNSAKESQSISSTRSTTFAVEASTAITAKTGHVDMHSAPDLRRAAVGFHQEEIRKSVEGGYESNASCQTLLQTSSTVETNTLQDSVSSSSKVSSHEETPKGRANRNVEQTFTERIRLRSCQQKDAISTDHTNIEPLSEATKVDHKDEADVIRKNSPLESLSVKHSKPCASSCDSAAVTSSQEACVSRNSDLTYSKSAFVPAETSEGKFNASSTLLPMNRRLITSTSSQQCDSGPDTRFHASSILEDNGRQLLIDVKNVTPKVEPENDTLPVIDKSYEEIGIKRKRSPPPTVKVEESELASIKVRDTSAEMKPFPASPVKKRRLSNSSSGTTKFAEKFTEEKRNLDDLLASSTTNEAIASTSTSTPLHNRALENNKIYTNISIDTPLSITHSTSYLPTPPVSSGAKRVISNGSRSLHDHRQLHSPVSPLTTVGAAQAILNSKIESQSQHLEARKYVRPSYDPPNPPERHRSMSVKVLRGSRSRSPVQRLNMLHSPVDQHPQLPASRSTQPYANAFVESFEDRRLNIPQQINHSSRRGVRDSSPRQCINYPETIPNWDDRHLQEDSCRTGRYERDSGIDAEMRHPTIINGPQPMDSARGRNLRSGYSSDRPSESSRSISPRYRQARPIARTSAAKEFSSPPRTKRSWPENEWERSSQSDNRFQGKPVQGTSNSRHTIVEPIPNRDLSIGNNSRPLIERVNLVKSQSQPRIDHGRNSQKTNQSSQLASPKAPRSSGSRVAGTRPPLDKRINFADHNESGQSMPLAVQKKGPSHGRNQAFHFPSTPIPNRTGRNNRNAAVFNSRLDSNFQKSMAKSLEDRIS